MGHMPRTVPKLSWLFLKGGVTTQRGLGMINSRPVPINKLQEASIIYLEQAFIEIWLLFKGLQ